MSHFPTTAVQGFLLFLEKSILYFSWLLQMFIKCVLKIADLAINTL